MDSTFCPDDRKWITELVELNEQAEPLRELEKELTFTSSKKAEVVESSSTSFNPKDEDKKSVDALVKLVLQSKTSTCYDEDDMAMLMEDAGRAVREFDSTNIDYISSDDDDESVKSNIADDSEDEDFDESDDDNEDNDEDDVMNNTSGPNVFQQILDRLGNTNNGQVRKDDCPDKLRKIEEELDLKDEKEFAVFCRYNERRAHAKAKEAFLREEKFFTGPDVGMTKAKYQELATKTCPILGADSFEPMVDELIVKNVEMPILACPIPHKAIRKLSTLALYTNLSDEPGNFQWKSNHVMEQLTVGQQVEKQKMREYQREVKYRPKKDELCQPDSVIVKVSFFQASEFASYDLKSAPEPKPGLEIELLGHHTLNDLKELFFCQRNYICSKNVEKFERWATITEAVTKYKDHLAMTTCPADVMFINDTCYTDGSELSEKYYKDVHKWIRETGQKIKEYKRGLMETTMISDLKIRFGYPYNYVHQGNCEHIVVFNSLRLPRAVEHETFPRYEVVGKYSTKYCRVDNEFLARWAVTRSGRFPEDPILLCNACVEQYCFTKGKKKDGSDMQKRDEFKLYPFLQIVAFI